MPDNVHHDAPRIAEHILGDMRLRTKMWKPLSQDMGIGDGTLRRRLSIEVRNLTLSNFLYAADRLGGGDPVEYLRRCLGSPADPPPAADDSPDEADLLREFEALRARMANRGFKLSVE